ncbi:TonB-dependent receptor plug domain-containing protein [Desulfosarcina variabilis]|uniref:TonB-dependent receptor plug domain-containing protein n=1 Tax=Desulfosarcina variabilis TaxID=2300 RepID=UPI003AFB25E3
MEKRKSVKQKQFVDQHTKKMRLRFLLTPMGWMFLVMLLLPWSMAAAQESHGHGHGHAAQSKDATAMDSIVVTAERIDAFIEKNPQQVVILGLEEIEKRNLLSVEEALNTMAGVDVKKSSGIGSRISIRGSGKAGGVLVLLNGRPLNSSQYGGADISSIPIDIVKSITVFKPPVPVWLGAGASEGAIVITTRDSVDARDDESKHVTRIRGAGGSYGQVEGTVSHRYSMKKGGAMVTASGKHRDGKRTNSDRDSGDLSLHWDRELGAGKRVELNGRYYLSEYGSAGPEDNPTPDARQSYQKGSLDSRLSGIIGSTGDYALNLYGDLIDLKDESQSELVSTLDNQKYGLKAENNWTDAEEKWGLQLSGILERDDVDHTLSGTHHRTTAGLGAQADRNWQAFSVTLGARGDYTSDFDVNPGFSGGLRYSLAKHWAIKANAGYTVNIPNFGQLYQPSHGSIDQSRGNPDLDKEKIWSYDLSTEFRKGKSHSFLVTLFRSDVSDPITYERGDDLIYRPVNANRSWRQGVEAAWKYALDLGLTMDASAVVQDSEIEETGNELTYTPRVKLKLALLYTLKSVGTRLETTVRYRSKQYSESQNREDQSLDDYTTVDFKAIQPFKIKKLAVEWFVNLDNLFDKRYEVHHGYPDDGFRFLTGLNLTF